MESVQTKISRVRKPRVHIIYEVETEGATVQRELPFVVGVLADLSGNAGQEKRPFRERKFIQIDRDNFDDVMTKIGPALTFKVENTLADDGSEISVDLKFNSMADFEPGRIVNQIEPLKNLLEIRNQIRDLMTKADRSEELEEILENILQDNSQLKQIATDLGIQADMTTPNQETVQ
jgi:type VI secretion system protein ImpB